MQQDSGSVVSFMEELRSGDTAAFAALFNRYWKELYHIAYRRLADQGEAEDLVQEVFAGVWERRETLVSRNALHQQAVSHLLARMEQMEHTILHAMEANELHCTIAEALDTFPENMRHIFALRAEEYTIAEIAAALELAEQTVKNTQTRALARLRDIIARKHPEINKSFYLLLALTLEN